jgi:hypothetical protein
MRSADELVRVFVEAALAQPNAQTDELVASLKARQVDAEAAECLVAFVPMAFAHVMLGDLGVTLPTAFLLKDPVTGTTARGVLRDEPIFRKACKRARSMLDSGPDGQRSATVIAADSAEWNVVARLKRNGGDPSTCGVTEAVLMRLSPSYLAKRKMRKWWKALWYY